MRARRLLVAALVAGALLSSGCGSDGTTSTNDDGTTSTTAGSSSTTTITAVDRDVPAAAQQTIDRIRALTVAGDYEGLAALALEHPPFTASFGKDYTDPAELAAAWRGGHIIDVLLPLLDLPHWYERQAGDGNVYYLTPRYMDEPTAENRAALVAAIGEDEVAKAETSGDYLGWRVVVSADGHWKAFVIGD